MEPEFKFFINHNGNQIEITPGNFPDLKFVNKRPVESCMSVRKVLEGELVITDGYQYDWLYAVKESNQRTHEINMEVQRLVNGSYSTYYRGLFTIASCKFDESRRTISIKQDPDDAYTPFLQLWDQEVNFLDAPSPASDPIINFHTWKYGLPQSGDFESRLFFFPSTVVSAYKEYQQYAVLIGEIDSEEGDHTGVSLYATEVISSNHNSGGTTNEYTTIDISNWSQIVNNDSVRRPNIDLFSTNFKIIRSSNIASYPNYDEVFTWFDGGIGGGTNFSMLWLNHQHTSTGTQQNTRKLTEALKYAVGQVNSGMEPALASDVSDFFSLPTSYIGDVANLYQDVRICQISDVKQPNASSPATIGKLKLKEFLEDLNMLGFFWFINASGKFQIEHYHYFDTLTDTNDLTTAVYAAYVLWKNEFEYLKEEVPKLETWRVQNGSRNRPSGNFFEIKMNYQSVDRRLEADEGNIYDIKTITFDVRDIYRNSKAYGKDLNVLIAVDDSNNISRAEDSASNYYNLNYPFDFDKLVGINREALDTGVSIIPAFQYGRYGVNAYLTHYSTYSSSNLQGIAVVNQSLVRRKTQVELTIPNFREVTFDYLGNWITELSNQGRIEESSENLINGTISLKIIHPEEQGSEAPVYPGIPVYPTDTIPENVCPEEEVKYALQLSQGYILVLSDGSLLDVTQV